MKRIIGLLLTVLVLAACDPITSTHYTTATGTAVHWRQNVSGSLERRITYVVPAKYATSKMMYAVNQAAQQTNRSPYLQVAIHVPNLEPSQITCSNHCVLIVFEDLPYPYVGITGTGWDSGGHMYGMASKARIDVGMTQDLTTRVVVHEVSGHGNGLGHPPKGTGPSVNGVLTTWDLALIKNAHHHWDTSAFSLAEPVPQTTTTRSLSAQPDKVWKTTREDVL